MNILKELEIDGMLLRQIPKTEQTLEICEKAIKQNPLSIQFADKKYLNSQICLEAVRKNGNVFRYIPNQFITEKLCELAIETDPQLLNNIPDDFKTIKICLDAVKKDVRTLSYIPQEKRYKMFNSGIEKTLVKKLVEYNRGWLEYMPNSSEIREICIKYMDEDFSISQYMPEQVKISEDILRYQMSKGKVKFENKYYDDKENKFKIEIKITYEGEKSYEIMKNFDDFDEFYKFLDGDLQDAELQKCNFENINLKNYNINGAIINGNILCSQGLYDGSYFDKIRKILDNDSNKYIKDNEITIENEFFYPKPMGENDIDKKFNNEIVHFFYISDIHLAHKIKNKFNEYATKEEIFFYIRSLVKTMVLSVMPIPINSYLLIAGDTSSSFELSGVFYKELVHHWDPKKIIVILGNHELWDPWVEIDENIETYRNFFTNLGITFLQNDLLCIKGIDQYDILHESDLLKMDSYEIRKRTQFYPLFVLGGIGFSGLNKKYNASNIRFGKSFEEVPSEVALKKDIQETKRFNIIYTKILENLTKSKVIILTHSKKEDWNAKAHNPYWIYVNGHNHSNYFDKSEKRTIYADNQIGYKSKKIGLKYFCCENNYDIFACYKDGIYKITHSQYIEFNRGKNIYMSFDRRSGIIYMLKKKDVYLFVIYDAFSKRSVEKSLYLLNGGKLEKIEHNRLEDMHYYYDNIDKYAKNVKQLLDKYVGNQKKLSDFIKHLGGSGKIHGSIVDIDNPYDWGEFSYCHLFVNPIDGKITPYFARDVKTRIVYKNLKTLLESQSCCKLIANNYLQLEKEAAYNFLDVQYSEQIDKLEGKSYTYDEGDYIYKISRIIKSLQYCIEKNVVRFWNEELLNYHFIDHIKQTDQIGELFDNRLLICEKDMEIT